MIAFDYSRVIDGIEKKSPFLARQLMSRVLGIVSPFNGHLKSKLTTWTKNEAVAELDCHRSVKNHVGSIHAGALFTLGESVAGLLILRNFTFNKFRFIITEASVVYHRQARGKVAARTALNAATVERFKKVVEKEPVLIKMKTAFEDAAGNAVAEVQTTWQVKAWAQVGVKTRKKRAK